MITWIIIGITFITSYLTFQNPSMMEKLQFNAALVVHRKQYYRLLTHAFIHVGWTHLLVNMLVLYFFGPHVESLFGYFFGAKASLYYVILYVGGILVSNAWSLIKHQNDHYYNAVGASGAVSAVLFAFIFLNPWEKLYLFAIVPIPAIIFAIGYLFYSYQMGKRKADNVAHDAHLLGAVFGFVFPLILKPDLFSRFIDLLPGF